MAKPKAVFSNFFTYEDKSHFVQAFVYDVADTIGRDVAVDVERGGAHSHIDAALVVDFVGTVSNVEVVRRRVIYCNDMEGFLDAIHRVKACDRATNL